MFNEEEDLELLQNSYSKKLAVYAQRTINVVIFCCIVVGLFNTLMWLSVYYFPELESKIPFFPSRFLTGILFILCGISLWLQQKSNSAIRMAIGKLLALIIILSGMFGIIFHNVEPDIFNNGVFIQTGYNIMKLWPPYPLPIYAALLFIGIGFLLFFLQTKSTILFICLQILNSAYSSLFIITFYIHAFKLFSEYNFNIEEFPRITTIFLFAVLSIGIYISRPREGIIALLTNNTLGGMLGRRLILLPLVVLFLVSILQTAGVKFLFIEPITAYVLSLFINLIISTFLILWVASATRKLDLDNRKLLIEHEKANKKLLSINKELDTFAYVVSHDLKAPLRGMTSLAQWLKDDYSDKIDDEGKKKLTMLINQSAHMNALINGILEYSRVGRKEEKHTLVDFKILVNEIIAILNQGTHITFVIDPLLPTLMCPEIQIKQVFQNLIGNAVKFMDKELGIISINCTSTDTFWVFSVCDNGPGIDNKYFDDLFKVFTSINRHANTETSGLGLSIVKKTVELWGGTVWVESKNLVKEALFSLPTQKDFMRNQKPILLTEDNEVDVMSMQRVFKELHISNQLVVTNNGQEALDYLRNPNNPLPCILLLDINMPKMNGLSLLKIIKNDPLLKFIPVIMLTSSDEEKDRNAAFAESIAGYILKPVDYSKLVDVVRSIDLYWSISELPEI